MSGSGGQKFRVFLSPWVIVGAVAILAAIFLFMARESIHKQREATTRLLVEQGDSLIRSFEASARTGEWMRWSPFQLQKLLIEMARQPGIDYVTVTDVNGVIIADSDPAMVGEVYVTDFDFAGAARLKQVAWRQVPSRTGADTFEVYRRFAPTEEPFRGFQGAGEPADYVIFVGLDMGPMLAAQDEDFRGTAVLASVLVLAGLAGMIALFLAQGYLSTRASLTRVRVFSDSLVENMPIGLAAVDAEGRISAFNASAEAILGKTAGEVMGRKSEDALPENWRGVLESIQGGRNAIVREIDCAGSGGRTLPLEIIATSLGEERGRPRGSVVLFRDLTEVRQLKAEIARSQRLASIGSLAAGVAHEIRNPLSSIKGFATYFKERLKGNSEDSRTADVMIQEVERLNRVIRQLLDLSRPMDIRKEPTPLVPLVEHTIRLIETQARKKGIRVQVESPADLPPVMADPDRVKQVLLNLCLNAIEAMKGGGSLTVDLRRQGDRMLRIGISDTGSGIPEGDADRIFDPFYTTKSSGTGLGLAIVHRIVEAHGGEIRVASTPGGGAIFSVLLPAAGSPGGQEGGGR